jgi:hypothetical protein
VIGGLVAGFAIVEHFDATMKDVWPLVFGGGMAVGLFAGLLLTWQDYRRRRQFAAGQRPRGTIFSVLLILAGLCILVIVISFVSTVMR